MVERKKSVVAEIRYIYGLGRDWVMSMVYPLYFLRPITTFLKNQNKKDLIGVKIGVAQAVNAKTM